MRIIIFVSFLFSVLCAGAQNRNIDINSAMCFFDYKKHLIVVNQDIESLENVNFKIEGISVDGKVYSLKTPVDEFNVGKNYKVNLTSENTDYILFFTELPIIEVSTSERITKENKVLASFKYIESNGSEIISSVGLRYRGTNSLSYPKKSFRIEFWEDDKGTETKDMTFLGMRSDDDWNLLAMYNEPLRIRNKTNHEIWRTIHTPYYQEDEPEAVNGIRMEYIEMFLNGNYQGVYALAEPLDRKQLKLKKHNGKIRGELYKGIEWNGAPNFEQLIPYDNNQLLWNGFEYKHPEEEIDWKNIYDFVDFVMNAPDENFYSSYQSKFEMGNLVDYFIFLNLLRAKDNTGKNIFVAKYKKNEPYFYSPWDLDGTFGIIWDGSLENRTDDIRTNRFYERVWKDESADGFRSKLSNRWKELRESTIQQTNLMEMFRKNHDYLKKNGIYKRELIAWAECEMNEAYLSSEHLSYMSDWIENRLRFLDEKFIISSTGIAGEERVELKVYPNPASECIYINIGEINTEKLEIKIYNLNGQFIKNIVCGGYESRTLEIPIHELAKGVYFLRISNEEISHTGKFVISF